MREKLHNLIDTIQEEKLLRKIYFYILGLKGEALIASTLISFLK